MKYIIEIPDVDTNITKKDEVIIRSGDNFTITGNINSLEKFDKSDMQDKTAKGLLHRTLKIMKQEHNDPFDMLGLKLISNELLVSIAYSLAKIADKE